MPENIIDLRDTDNGEATAKALHELLKKMHDSFPENGTEEEWEAFESNPVFIGYGDTVYILPNYAQEHNGLMYGIESMIEEIEA